MDFKTEDGKTFSSYSHAQNHANELAAKYAVNETKSAAGAYMMTEPPFPSALVLGRTAPAAATVTVTSDALNLRAEASGSADIVKVLNKGDVLTVTGEESGGWLPVEHEGAKGWVSSRFVE